jgi:hypothetical protein
MIVPESPENCPALNATIDVAKTYACRGSSDIVNESIGEVVAIELLPGCNAIWTGNISKPACPQGRVEGADMALVEPEVWVDDVGYID